MMFDLRHIDLPDDDMNAIADRLRRSLDNFKLAELYEQGGLEAIRAAKRREAGRPKLTLISGDSTSGDSRKLTIG